MYKISDVIQQKHTNYSFEHVQVSWMASDINYIHEGATLLLYHSFIETQRGFNLNATPDLVILCKLC